MRRLVILAGIAVCALTGCSHNSTSNQPGAAPPAVPGQRPTAAQQQQGYNSAPAAVQQEFGNAPHGQVPAPPAGGQR